MVLARNWRSKTGEIDIVVRSEDLVVLCEVKTHSSDRFGAPVEAITLAKLNRMRRVAGEWLAAARASGTLGRHDSGLEVRMDGASVRLVNGETVVEVLEGIS